MKKKLTYLLIFLLGSIFGAFIIFNLVQPKLSKKQSKNDFQIKRFNKDFNFSDDDNSQDDFDKVKDEVEKAMHNSSSFFKIIEKSMEGSLGVDGGAALVRKETPDSIILELDITNIDNSTLKIDVKDQLISISGETRVEEKNESASGSMSSIVVSSFSRTHPVPQGTRASGLRIENKDKNTLQLIFPRNKK